MKQEWKKFREELNNVRSLREFVLCIPSKGIETLATILLMILCIMPLHSMLVFKTVCEGRFIIEDYNNCWFYNMLPIGLLGCVIFFYNLAYSIYKAREQDITLWQWIKARGLMVFLMLMLGWSVLSCYLSNDRNISFFGDAYRKEGLLAYFMYAGIVALALTIRNKKKIRGILEVLVGTSAILGVFGWLNNPVINKKFSINAAGNTFHQPNHYGYYICITLLVCVVLTLTDSNKVNAKKWWIIGKIAFRSIEIVLITNGLVLCHSLGPLLGVVLAIVFYTIFVYFISKKKIRKILGINLLIIITILGGSVNKWNLKKEYIQLSSDINNMITGENFDAIGSRRGILWRYGVQLVLDKPVFGYGPDNLGKAYEQMGATNDRPHNELLQFAASLGLPAMIFYISGLMCHLITFFKKFKQLDLFQIGFYVVIGGYLISSLFGNTMFNTSPYFFMILAISYKNNEERVL